MAISGLAYWPPVNRWLQKPDELGAYAAEPVANAEAYCEQRFRSYDPASGTYLGHDRPRHPCP